MWKRIRSRLSHKNDTLLDLSASAAVSVHASTSSVVNPHYGKNSTSTVPATGESQDASHRMSLLSIGPFSNHRSPSPEPGQKLTDTIGLQIVYQPMSIAHLNIIFVHGLGGANHKTWSKFQDPNLFWPQQWLPLEPEICASRILSFGYNASFGAGSPKSVSNITDFAKDLLFAMRFGKDDDGKDLEIGRVPTIFVVHSMGGLVVKKAYLLGQNDENYQHIVQSISAIMFLSTPHRGTNLAELLNRILSAAFQSPRNFISELNKSSPALEELNEQFRHVAKNISIISFYETLPTAIGPKKLMVLEKDSSILGYPGEISKSLNADHHDVCKYASQEDSNYVSVRDALCSLVGQFRSQNSDGKMLAGESSQHLKAISTLFASSQAPEDDFNFFRQRWMPGTCEWILSEPVLKQWLELIPQSCVSWLNAPPASGKSILSTHVIDHLQQLGHNCQYFFFRFGDQTKRSTNAFLRSIGFQIAATVPAFRSKLTKLCSDNIRLETMDARTIWQKVFTKTFSDMELWKPLYWVIDALDESDSPKLLLDILQDLPLFRTPIRVLVISRKTELLSRAFERLSLSIPVDVIQTEGQENVTSDIRKYTEKEIDCMHGSDELKKQIIESVLRQADSNFLWVYLILDEISGCHTEQAIRQTLDEIPVGMNALYQRMELAVTKKPKHSDRALAKMILNWTVCAHRSLSLEELSQALSPDFAEFLDLKRTIHDVCGHFIVVDHKSQVVMVHKTARDYLIKTPNLQLSINLNESHGELFSQTISFLLNSKLRSKLGQSQYIVRTAEPFLLYAATSWTYHLRQASIASVGMLDLLVRFFNGQFVLTWIHSLALFSQPEIMIKAARALTSFVSLNRRLNVDKNPLLHRLQDLELLDLWAIDLVKLVGKFGRHLKDNPAAIYKIIPQLCPKDSIIYRQFNNSDSLGLSVSGISNSIWDDCLARISLHDGAKAWKIRCAGPYFAVLSSVGTIFLWSSSNFEEICMLQHAEYVITICFNSRSDTLVSYGRKLTKIWAIPSGQLMNSVANPIESKALAITFAENDSKILIGSDDKLIRSVEIHNSNAGWRVLDSALLKENSQIDGGFITSPSVMAFNAEATQIAVAYRGYPLSVWSTSEPQLIGRCKRAIETRPDQARSSAATWMAVERVTWNPITGHVLGIYKDGCLFKWDPVSDDNQVARTIVDEVEISPDGRLFVTSDSNGTVKVWNFLYFSVIYHLSSDNLVAGLAFSPDCSRFYDLRDSSINIWEPNSLIRLSDTEEALSETASESQAPTSISQTSEACLVSLDPVYIIAAAPEGPLYCAANETGAVDLYEKSEGKVLELMKFLNFLTVDHLTWSDDGRYIAASDIGGNIIVKHLNHSSLATTTAKLEVQSTLTAKVKIDESSIHQILFNGVSTMLLIISRGLAQIWSVESGSLDVVHGLERGVNRKWINHPLQKSFLLAFGPMDLKVFRWIDLAEVACLRFRDSWSRSHYESLETNEGESLQQATLPLDATYEDDIDRKVNRVMLTQDGKNILIQLSKVTTQGRSTKSLLIIETSSLVLTLDSASTRFINCIDISSAVLDKIEVPLGILSGGRLVFLDKDLWICTWKLDSIQDINAIKRQYFIPRDWISARYLHQCCILKDGTFLCPKGDEIAAITSTLGASEW